MIENYSTATHGFATNDPRQLTNLPEKPNGFAGPFLHTYDTDLDSRAFAENLTRAIVTEKGLDEEAYQQILQVLLKPHKHKHREGKKAKVRPSSTLNIS